MHDIPLYHHNMYRLFSITKDDDLQFFPVDVLDGGLSSIHARRKRLNLT